MCTYLHKIANIVPLAVYQDNSPKISYLYFMHKDHQQDTKKDTIKGVYPVLGMSCASCASSAESMVKHEEGVISAEVNYGTGNLTVEYQPALTNITKLKQAIQQVGYDLLVEDEAKQQET